MAGKATAAEPIRDKKDIAKVMDQLEGRNKLLFKLGINFGLRITDLLSLKIGDLRGRKEIEIQEGKTKKKRPIYFSDDIIKICANLRGENDEYLFKSRQGGNKQISRQMAHKILNDAVERAGLTEKVGNVGTHTLRKTFGYHMYKGGEDLALLQNIFGHSSQKVTLRYIGIQKDDIKKAYRTLSL